MPAVPATAASGWDGAAEGGTIAGAPGRAPGRPAIMARLPPFFYYANALKYLASAAAAVAILNGNRAEAVTLQLSVLVLIGFKWLAAAAGLWA